MIKMTAHLDVPRRGKKDITEHDLAFNPHHLKLIAGAISTVSGLNIDDLLQPELERLEASILWALDRLHSMAVDDESQFTPSFPLLTKKFQETRKAINK